MRTGNYFRIALIALVLFALAVAISACGNNRSPIAPLMLTFSVSGTVTDETGEGLAGVLLMLTPGGFSVVTDANGEFAISGLLNGDYVLAPSLDGWTFEPASLPIAGSGSDIAILDFTAIDESVPEWVHTWGGAKADWSRDITVDDSGNAYVVGETLSFEPGSCSLSVLKYSSNGDLLWQRTWGGDSVDSGWSIATDVNGDVFVTGYTFSFGAGNCDVVLLKYSSTGTLLWQKTWGGVESDYGDSVSLDGSGNVYITGETASFGAGFCDAFVLKYSSGGDLLWEKTWGGTGSDYGWDLALDEDNNVYVTGYTASFGSGAQDIFLLKYSPEGVLLWQKVWGGSGTDCGYALAIIGLENIYVSGFTSSFGAGRSDLVLLKYSSEGDLLWQRTWGGTGSDYGEGVTPGANGNLYVVGGTDSFGSGNYDLVLLEYTPSGELLWQGTWGGSHYDTGSSIAVDTRGRVYLAGRATEASGLWSTPEGAASSPDGAHMTPEGTESESDGTETVPDGVETEPEGVEDEGGGGFDILVMKIDPSKW